VREREREDLERHSHGCLELTRNGGQARGWVCRPCVGGNNGAQLWLLLYAPLCASAELTCMSHSPLDVGELLL
jgi:hypothetical protein